MTNLYHKDIYKFDEPIKSYWESTINTNVKYKSLEKNIKTNIVVIGGGYTGISCALSLAKNFDEDVVLLEAGHIGWGSSARNAGFCCIPPAKMSVKKMFNKFGKIETKKFFKNTIEGSNFTKNLITEYKIDCDLTGNCNYEVAPHPSYFNSIKEEANLYKTEFGIETEVFSKKEFNEIGHMGEEQFGAFSYKPGFAINPLKFLLGLAKQAEISGVKIFQKSKVNKIEKNSGKFNVISNGQIITANKIVMATNGFYQDDLFPQLNNMILPVISNIIITRPLSKSELDSHNFITRNPVLNIRNLLFYYRLLSDNRFLFGARGDVVGSEQSSIIKSKKMEKQMKKVFPNWKDVKIDYNWRGLVAVTTKFTPSIGKLDEDEIYYSFGYQANGVNTAPWSGNELAKLIVSNSKELKISKFYQGLPKKFPFPKLRLFYLRLYLMYCSIIDK
ncbi:MAG: Gamma-glutamylputrescine oxidoreductase [Alphaproteobacteria bacterium MarineAlpha5_Bin5]|nr:MAG: Gamma-glutamylputrescine oxidoreductase [Alphaproteobacteria bacterium MarineAlpha5_Bin5]PPR52378.1 MAG: Gamma-glutamylputrescine oxidoreductase [Alphaproteobacteria bacterium MarineAlpha5_Bin4]|tara:strand:+ start:45 stop:1379 length:1335 start_codon:yes stop_codon:yes gene_type:complete